MKFTKLLLYVTASLLGDQEVQGQHSGLRVLHTHEDVPAQHRQLTHDPDNECYIKYTNRLVKKEQTKILERIQGKFKGKTLTECAAKCTKDQYYCYSFSHVGQYQSGENGTCTLYWQPLTTKNYKNELDIGKEVYFTYGNKHIDRYWEKYKGAFLNGSDLFEDEPYVTGLSVDQCKNKCKTYAKCTMIAYDTFGDFSIWQKQGKRTAGKGLYYQRCYLKTKTGITKKDQIPKNIKTTQQLLDNTGINDLVMNTYIKPLDCAQEQALIDRELKDDINIAKADMEKRNPASAGNVKAAADAEAAKVKAAADAAAAIVAANVAEGKAKAQSITQQVISEFRAKVKMNSKIAKESASKHIGEVIEKVGGGEATAADAGAEDGAGESDLNSEGDLQTSADGSSPVIAIVVVLIAFCICVGGVLGYIRAKNNVSKGKVDILQDVQEKKTLTQDADSSQIALSMKVAPIPEMQDNEHGDPVLMPKDGDVAATLK